MTTPKQPSPKPKKEVSPAKSKETKEQVIYIETDDEIADVCEVFHRTPEERLCLVFPPRSPLLLSKINIQLLLHKAKEAGKKLVCVTKDPIGKRHLQDLRVPVRDGVEGSTQQVSPPTEVAVDTPQHWWERWMPKRQAASLPSPTSQVEYTLRFNKPGKKLLFTLLFLSVALFVFIGYIAIPGATIYIDPQVASQTRSLNILFVDPAQNNPSSFAERTVNLYPLDLVFDRQVTIGSTGQEFFGENARGTMTIYNNDNRTRPIVGGSRLQNSEGLLYLTDTFVEIPGRTADGPGSLEVSVTASEFDAYGTVMGERGNAGPSKFYFPALTQESQQLLWAESHSAFSGGTTEMNTFVKPEDVEAARKKVEQELEFVAIGVLQDRLAEMNAEQGTQYQLFDRMDRGGRIIQREVLEVLVPEVAGESIVSFDAYGRMRVRGWYYDQREVYDIMRRHMEERLSPTENLLKVDDRSLKFTTLFEEDINISRGIIKATASMEGIVAYNFFDSRTTLIRNIKQNAIGKSKFDAEREIQNLPQVRSVRIVTWPFWAPTLPTIQDNIEIVVSEVE